MCYVICSWAPLVVFSKQSYLDRALLTTELGYGNPNRGQRVADYYTRVP